MAGIYIHIPFCRKACHYCDFHFSTNMQLAADMVEAIVHELHNRQSLVGGEDVQTIYFGGGTPSVLSAAQLEKILNAVYKNYSVSASPEVTLEANPDDIHANFLLQLNALSINRLSIGIQSFNNSVLKYFNRVHDAAQAKQSILLAREAGFRNINADLIYALPEMDGYRFEEDMEQMIALEPEHISAYTLTIEPKTVFGSRYKKGLIKTLEEDIAAGQFSLLSEHLQNAGYEHYEISNFCKPGCHSRHNSSYWEGEKYVGVGPGAHGFDGKLRYANVSNNAIYIKKVLGGADDYYTAETLSATDMANELMMTALRTTKGLDLLHLSRLISAKSFAEVKNRLTQFEHKGLCFIENDRVLLTPSGRILADRITLELFIGS